jgi:hypothetical protein
VVCDENESLGYEKDILVDIDHLAEPRPALCRVDGAALSASRTELGGRQGDSHRLREDRDGYLGRPH